MPASVLVCYVIQGDEDDPETGIQSSFRVARPSAPRALTLFRLREVFPFEGTFHFRLKIPDASRPGEYCWLDLATDGDDILELARNLGGLEGDNGSEPRVHLKILPLDLGFPPEEAPLENDDAGVFSTGGMAEALGHGGGDRPEHQNDLGGGVSGMDLPGERFEVDDERQRHQHHQQTQPPPQRGRRREFPSSSLHSDEEEKRFDRHASGGGGGGGGDGGGGGHHDSRFDRPRGGTGEGGSGGGDRGRGGGGAGGGERGRVGENEGGGYGAYGDDEEGADWKASVETSFQSGLTQASQGVKDLHKKSAQVAKTMGFGAKKLWQTIHKGVGGAQTPSVEATEHLLEIAIMLGTPFSPTSREHLKDVGKVWSCLFPDDEFEGPESARWLEAGFQDANIAGDFRGTGVLALKGMVFFCEHYERKANALFRAQTGRSASTYPWAVVANNLTLMLADVLELRADHFLESRKGHWGIFERPEAYFEVFCMCFRLLDYEWTKRQARRDHFGQIIGLVKTVVVELLESGPPNLQAFMGQAEEMGMLR